MNGEHSFTTARYNGTTRCAAAEIRGEARRLFAETMETMEDKTAA